MPGLQVAYSSPWERRQGMAHETRTTTWCLCSIALSVISLLLPAIFWFRTHAFSQHSDHFTEELQTLSQEVSSLKAEQAIPSELLDRSGSSICYIVGTYKIGFPHQPPALRTRISGTGFVVASGLIATNRHVAQPWYKDRESESLIRAGASPSLESLAAYFPGVPSPIRLTPAVFSDSEDLAIVSMASGSPVTLRPLALSPDKPHTGDRVVVIGYPMGVLGMMAKSPNEVYARLESRGDTQIRAGELAALSLIRPSPTFGHLGDVVGDKLVYDAPTAKGASGGPVFNSRGQVVGVNQAYIDGFSGGNIGIAADILKPLIESATQATIDWRKH